MRHATDKTKAGNALEEIRVVNQAAIMIEHFFTEEAQKDLRSPISVGTWSIPHWVSSIILPSNNLQGSQSRQIELGILLPEAKFWIQLAIVSN